MPHQVSQSSHLLAILLIAKSEARGPKLIFHYPQNPVTPSSSLFSTSSSAAPGWYGGASSADTADESSESGWGDSSSSDEGGEDGDIVSKSGRGSTGGGKSSVMKGRGIWSRDIDDDEDEMPSLGNTGYDLGREAMSNNAKPTTKTVNGKEANQVEWDHILGFRRESLEKLLSPHRAFHKRKFEIGIDGCFYVGAPMFIRDDGLWRKKRRRNKKYVDPHRQESLASATLRDEVDDEAEDEEDIQDEEAMSLSKIKMPPIFEPGYGHSSKSASDAGSTSLDTDMSMFHVVFVMNPPALEYQARIKEMYDNVARKFAKALKYQQARSDYVWTESRKILGMKGKARENRTPMTSLWSSIMSASTLAKSIAIIYDSISNSKIAHIHLDKNFETSFQIPQALSTPKIPTATDPQMPGLWLTTSFPDMDEDDDTDTPFTQRFALLLLEDTETLIKSIEGDTRDETSHLAFFIRSLIPTKSLYKLSIRKDINISDISRIADLLLYWRRARLIPPLSPRDTYIVSPNADMRALSSAALAYAARFPTLPSLYQMLSLLSGIPRQFFTFFPSPDHRTVYMEILAWLMRGGWVTQLRTFAWVRVTPDIKSEVAVLVERELREEEENAAAAALAAEVSGGRSSALSDGRGSISSPSRRSPHLRPNDSTPNRSPVRPSSNSSSNTSSARTATFETKISPMLAPIALPPVGNGLSTLKRPSPLHINQNASPPEPITVRHSPQLPPTSPTISLPPQNHTHTFPPVPLPTASHIPLPPTPSFPSFSLDDPAFQPSLVINPLRASSREARWLERIRDRFEDRDVRELWPVLLKYFDGRKALEDISVREGIKRKRVTAVLGIVRAAGWLVEVRHW